MTHPTHILERRVAKLVAKTNLAIGALTRIELELRDIQQSLQPSPDDMHEAEDRADVIASAQADRERDIRYWTERSTW